VSELRRDPITGEAVIVAGDRALRPTDLVRAPAPAPKGAEGCPFCPGAEASTPPAVEVLGADGRPAGDGAWAVRVIPNRYPALPTAHHVIIESPRHDAGFADLGEGELALILRAWQGRLRAGATSPELRAVQVFRNEGAASGASLAHPHSQSLGLPLIPPVLAAKVAAAGVAAAAGRCPWCELIASERADGRRVVHDTADHLVIQPYAQRFPFETWILPTAHAERFEEAAPPALAALAAALRTTAASLDRTLDRPPFTLSLQTAPLRPEDFKTFHWHLELRPALNPVGGFEWGSGTFINPTRPEDSAAILRGQTPPLDI
jgi:UDPglucose--hexose-1-phosphate uridylyltransferase